MYLMFEMLKTLLGAGAQPRGKRRGTRALPKTHKFFAINVRV